MKITTGLGALVIGLALASTGAIAKEAPRSHTQVVAPRTQQGPLYNYVPQATPAAPTAAPTFSYSPGGISSHSDDFGGPGYNPPAVGQ
jgi:hypothetical protein